MNSDIVSYIDAWRKGSWMGPYKITIIPTDVCNLRCRSCWSANLDRSVDIQQYEIPDNRLIELINESRALEVKEWHIAGGGEPMMRSKALLPMIEKIKSLGMMGDLTTNGTLFDRAMVGFLIDIKWDMLCISLDGPDSQTNDSLRLPAGTFNRVIATLEHFRILREGLLEKNPKVVIHCVISSANYTRLLEMVRLAAAYQLDGIFFDFIRRETPICDQLLFDKKAYGCIVQEQIDKAKIIAAENQLWNNLIQLEDALQIHMRFLKASEADEDEEPITTDWLSFHCYQPWYNIMITSNGSTSPCCLIAPFLQDNVKEKSLKDIWLGEAFSRFREGFMQCKLSDPCIECNSTLRQEAKSIQSFLRGGTVAKYPIFEKLAKLFHTTAMRGARGTLSKNAQKTISQQSQGAPEEEEKSALHRENALCICLVSREYPPDTGWGGIGTYTYNLAHGLADKGHKVFVICQSLDGEREYKDGNVNVMRIRHPMIFAEKGSLKEFPLRLEYSWRVHQKICELSKREHIHIIEGPNFSGELFIHSLFRKAPIVTRLHTHYSEIIQFYGWHKTFDLKLSCWLENAVILRSNLVICSTYLHTQLVCAEAGIRRDNVKIIPLGVPLSDLQCESGKKFDTPTVLFIGRLEKRKGVHILINAVPFILKEIPKAQILIIGRDTFLNNEASLFHGSENISFKSMLLRNIPESCLNNVKFLGYVEPEGLASYLKACDIFVAPSLYESAGFIYLEAMSYAKPVIGCRAGGVPEVVKDQETGLLVPPEDHVALAKAIVKLVNDNNLRKEMGLAARKHIELNFTREIMVENTLAAYRKVLKSCGNMSR